MYGISLLALWVEQREVLILQSSLDKLLIKSYPLRLWQEKGDPERSRRRLLKTAVDGQGRFRPLIISIYQSSPGETWSLMGTITSPHFTSGFELKMRLPTFRESLLVILKTVIACSVSWRNLWVLSSILEGSLLPSYMQHKNAKTS